MLWLVKIFSSIAGLEQILGYTEKSCIASYYRQFSMNIRIQVKVLLVMAFGQFGLTKLFLLSQFFIFISAESCLNTMSEITIIFTFILGNLQRGFEADEDKSWNWRE